MLLCKHFLANEHNAGLTFSGSMKAWGKSLDSSKSSGIRFLADPSGEFTRAWDVEFDASKILGNPRSKRYAVTTDNGKVVKASVEPDNTGISSESTLICFARPRTDMG
jgi:peroxiredoxin